jgi:hypothetical protein
MYYHKGLLHLSVRILSENEVIATRQGGKVPRTYTKYWTWLAVMTVVYSLKWLSRTKRL